MCGRLAQTRSVRTYANDLGFIVRDDYEDLVEPIANYNAGPAVPHWTLRLHDDALLPEKITWQWLSHWAKEKGMKPAINAKLEKLLGGYYRGLMKAGRIIVPADGWYEWTGEPKNRQPWYIKPKDGAPLFLAALTNHQPGKDDPEGAGYVIVTNESKGGMVDVHDRRPVALTPDDARIWMDLSFSYQQAESIVREQSLGEESFDWHQVSRDVNGYKMHDAHLIEPI